MKWYVTAFANKVLLTALANSVIVGLGAVAICLVIGVPTALALDRYEFPGKAILRRFVILPLTLPGLITGVSMLAFFNILGISLSLGTVLVGHGTALTAIVVTNVFARLQRYDRRIEEASADLGAGPLRTFWYVTLPNIRSTLIGSSLIAFTLSFDEIPVTFFLTGRDKHTADVYLVDGPARHYAGDQRDRHDHHCHLDLPAARRGLHHERRGSTLRGARHPPKGLSPCCRQRKQRVAAGGTVAMVEAYATLTHFDRANLDHPSVTKWGVDHDVRAVAASRKRQFRLRHRRGAAFARAQTRRAR